MVLWLRWEDFGLQDDRETTWPKGGMTRLAPTTAHRTASAGGESGNSLSRSVRQMTQAGLAPACSIQSKTQTWLVPPPPTGSNSKGPSAEFQTWTFCTTASW